MAQHKYDLITVRTSPEGPQRHHPWYKERLRLKFLDTSKPSSALEGKKWTFIANGIDDFRSGRPTAITGESMVRKGKANPVPLIDTKPTEVLKKRSSSSLVTASRKPSKMSTNPGWRTLYHKCGPQRQMQQEHINDLVSRLLKHPLGLYPHLEESIPPEVLEGVVGIVDPELKSSMDRGDFETSNTPSLSEEQFSEVVIKEEEEEEESVGGEEEAEDGDTEVPSDESTQAGVYRFPLKKTSAEKEREESMLASHQVISATQQSRVNQVTHDLVQWAQDLGDSEGEQYIIDESTIKSLFGSDYESKPVLSAPIHVVELLNVPAELRLESRQHSSQSPTFSSRPSTVEYRYRGYERYGGKRVRSITTPWMEADDPRQVKTKYGVWYLPVNMWRPRPANEPLRDPKEVAAGLENNELMKRLNMDRAMSQLHGAREFKQFVLVNKKGAPMPKFLKNVNLNGSSDQTRKSSTFGRRLQSSGTAR